MAAKKIAKKGPAKKTKTTKPNGSVEDSVNAPEVRSPERGQAVAEQVVQSVAFIHAAYANRFSEIRSGRFGHPSLLSPQLILKAPGCRSPSKFRVTDRSSQTARS